MLKKQQTNKNGGFTIIEVLIVLAIAALILLVVLLAVPSLQRNARNTNRKSDVGRVASAVQTVLGNNNGQVSSVTDANVQAELGELGYYQSTDVTVSATAATSAGLNSTTVDSVVVYPKSTCGTGAKAGKAINGTNRQFAVVFTVEKNVKQCQAI
jgi:prepilin-type N-terminal cleavage/methylation domain-containing protein